MSIENIVRPEYAKYFDHTNLHPDATIAIGVIDMRLLTTGIPNSLEI